MKSLLLLVLVCTILFLSVDGRPQKPEHKHHPNSPTIPPVIPPHHQRPDGDNSDNKHHNDGDNNAHNNNNNGTVVFCTLDAKICSDGTVVARDPNNKCAFKPCPSEYVLVFSFFPCISLCCYFSLLNFMIPTPLSHQH